MVSQEIVPTESNAADDYVGKTDQDLKLNYLEGFVKAAKAFADLGQHTINADDTPTTGNIQSPITEASITSQMNA
ncbi:hypothetical protein G7Y79_00021g050820 [Physcia stellaris]|nr:hypothetical protein G7Y79_00021g050820 [Physcia stellaris]